MLINLGALLLNAALSVILGLNLGPKEGIYGLTAAFTIASIFNALVLFITLRSELKKELAAVWTESGFDSSIVSTILKTTVASVVMGIVAYYTLRLFEPLVNTRTAIGILIQAGLSGTVAVASFIAMAAWLGQDEVKSLKSVVQRIFPKK